MLPLLLVIRVFDETLFLLLPLLEEWGIRVVDADADAGETGCWLPLLLLVGAAPSDAPPRLSRLSAATPPASPPEIVELVVAACASRLLSGARAGDTPHWC